MKQKLKGLFSRLTLLSLSASLLLASACAPRPLVKCEPPPPPDPRLMLKPQTEQQIRQNLPDSGTPPLSSNLDETQIFK